MTILPFEIIRGVVSKTALTDGAARDSQVQSLGYCLPVADDHANGGLLRPSNHQEIATGWIPDVSLAEIPFPMVEKPHGGRDAAPLIRRLCSRSFCEGAFLAENENGSDEGAARERGRRGLE